VESFILTKALTASSRSRSASVGGLIAYSDATLERADLALRCSPFHLKLLQEMGRSGVSVMKIAGKSGVELGYTKRQMSELMAESAAVWLIQVGMLRREVDGQGLTDSFRLTPLGGQVIDRWEGRELTDPSQGDAAKPTLRERLQNLLNRWLRG
jgi:hypothetical protein